MVTYGHDNTLTYVNLFLIRALAVRVRSWKIPIPS